MLENYLIKGLIIGIVFGVPAGAVGMLSIQRGLTQGVWAGFVTGLGSSVAEVFYACAGVFGITMISDFLLEHQSIICLAGCLLVIIIGIRNLTKRVGDRDTPAALREPAGARQLVSCFLSAFAVTITNPAAILSYMVVFSVFQISGTESTGENVQLVAGIFFGTCVWWSAIAVIAGLIRKRITDRFYLKLTRIFGGLMVLFGAAIGIRGILVYAF